MNKCEIGTSHAFPYRHDQENEMLRMTSRKYLVLLLLVCTGLGSELRLLAAVADSPPSSGGNTWPPVPLEMQVPYAPTAYSSDGRDYLTYELYLRNFGNSPLTLRRLEVLEDAVDTAPLAVFDYEDLDSPMVYPLGAAIPPAENADRRQIVPGASVVIFLSFPLDSQAEVPAALRHRLMIGETAVSGAIAGTSQVDLQVIGAPLQGENWRASGGPDNNSGHRRGIIVSNGVPTISRRFAMDWVQIENGTAFAGDEDTLISYHSYGEPVFAVADATVASLQEGIPENTPGTRDAVPTTDGVPISADAVAGNFITLDLGNGQFARYLHLQPGSLRVRAGERVRRGQALGSIGNSGDSSRPHLHFEITTSPDLLNGEGLPYLIDEFRVSTINGGNSILRLNSLPLPRDDRRFAFAER